MGTNCSCRKNVNLTGTSEKRTIEDNQEADKTFSQAMDEYSFRASPQNWFLRKISHWINKKENHES